MTILGNAVEPPLLSLLSSTAEPPAALWAAHPAAPRLVPDTEPFAPRPLSSADRARRPAERGALADPVLELAAPRLRECYIQLGGLGGLGGVDGRGGVGGRGGSGSLGTGEGAGGTAQRQPPLGSRLPHLSLQVRRLGGREFALELALADARGTPGIIRLSTHKKTPSLHPSHDPPLAHLPLAFPADPLTPWAEVSLHLPALLALFTALRPARPAAPAAPAPRRGKTDAHGRTSLAAPAAARALPGAQWGAVLSVRVYANCRLRRVWLSEDGERTLDSLGRARNEWDLHAAAALER